MAARKPPKAKTLAEQLQSRRRPAAMCRQAALVADVVLTKLAEQPQGVAMWSLPVVLGRLAAGEPDPAAFLGRLHEIGESYARYYRGKERADGAA